MNDGLVRQSSYELNCWCRKEYIGHNFKQQIAAHTSLTSYYSQVHYNDIIINELWASNGQNCFQCKSVVVYSIRYFVLQFGSHPPFPQACYFVLSFFWFWVFSFSFRVWWIFLFMYCELWSYVFFSFLALGSSSTHPFFFHLCEFLFCFLLLPVVNSCMDSLLLSGSHCPGEVLSFASWFSFLGVAFSEPACFLYATPTKFSPHLFLVSPSLPHSVQ